MAKQYCYLTRKHGGLYIDCSYDEQFVKTLKRRVPYEERNYDPINKTWWVSDKYSKQIERDCRYHFENVIEC